MRRWCVCLFVCMAPFLCSRSKKRGKKGDDIVLEEEKRIASCSTDHRCIWSWKIRLHLFA